MPYTTYNIPAALQGIDQDSERIFLNKSLSPFMKNMVVENTKVRKFLGYETLGSNLPLAGNGKELVSYTDARGGVHLLAFTTTNIYEYNASDDEWENITPLATSAPLSLVGHWKLNDSAADTVVADASLKLNDGVSDVNTDTIDDASGKINECFDLSLNGGSHYVSMSDQAYYSFGDGSVDSAFSISAWIFVAVGAVNQPILTKYDAIANKEWYFMLSSAERIRLHIYDEVAEASIRVDGDSTLAAGWHHVVVTYDGSSTAAGISMYVDGVAETPTVILDGTYVAMTASTSPVVIGSDFDTGAFFQDKLDDIRLYNVELSITDIEHLYNSDSGTEAQTLFWFTGDDDDRFSHDVFTDANEFALNGGDALVITNGTADGIFYYEGQSGDRFALLATGIGSFSNAKEISSFWNYFFMWNYSLGDQVVRSWKRSAVGDVDDFSGAGSAFGTLTDSIGNIVRAKKLGYDIIIYSDNSITTGVKSGGVTTFEFPTLVYETGLFAAKAIWDFVNIHYFIGTDQKFYGYSGGQNLTEIGLGIENAFFSELKMSLKERINFGLDTNNHKLYCHFPDSSSDFGKKYYAYNYRAPIKSWEFGEFYHDVRDFSLFTNKINYYCDSDQFEGVYCDESALYCDDSFSQAGYPQPVFIDSSGNVFKISEALGTFAGQQIDCEYQIPDFSISAEQFETRFTWVGLNLMSLFAGDFVAVQYAVDEDIDNNSWTTLTDSPITLTQYWQEHRLPLDVVGRRISFRLVQNDGSKDLQVRTSRISAMPLSEE